MVNTGDLGELLWLRVIHGAAVLFLFCIFYVCFPAPFGPVVALDYATDEDGEIVCSTYPAPVKLLMDFWEHSRRGQPVVWVSNLAHCGWPGGMKQIFSKNTDV